MSTIKRFRNISGGVHALPWISKLWWTTLSSKNTREAHVIFNPAFSRSLPEKHVQRKIIQKNSEYTPMEEKNQDIWVFSEPIDGTPVCRSLVDTQASNSIFPQSHIDDWARFRYSLTTLKLSLLWRESAHAENTMLFAPGSVILRCARCRMRVWILLPKSPYVSIVWMSAKSA